MKFKKIIYLFAISVLITSSCSNNSNDDLVELED